MASKPGVLSQDRKQVVPGYSDQYCARREDFNSGSATNVPLEKGGLANKLTFISKRNLNFGCRRRALHDNP